MRPSSILAVLVASVLSLSLGARSFAEDFDDHYDRLDGRGRSGKKVNVIEWEGNLEIHVYPGGSVKGLALKIDDRDPDKKVMVIGYRFNSTPGEQLIRRNVLGISLTQGFKVYRDPRTGKEYDKFVISNDAAGSPLIAYQLEPAPTQLYPEGPPAVAGAGKKEEQDSARQPASRREPAETLDEDSGTIRAKSW